MTAALGHVIMRHPEVKGSMEQFLVQHVIPEFSSNTEPYIRAIVSALFHVNSRSSSLILLSHI